MPARVLEYKQIADIVNPIVKEELGEEANILQEDLSNVVDVGRDAANAMAVDRILDKMVARIGRVVFYDKVYRRKDLYGFLKDNIEYGILKRISNNYLLDAEENPSYQLQEGQSVDPFVIKNLPQPSVSFFEDKLTEEIDFTELRQQYKLVFTSAEELARFTSLCFTTIENSKNFRIEVLQKRLMNATIARYIHAQKEVDLVALYNAAMGYTGENRKDVSDCLYNTDFLKFASMTIKDYYNSLKNMSTLYNLAGAPTWSDSPKMAVLSKFEEMMSYYLESTTYHADKVSLGENFISVPAWQNEPSRDWAKISQIDVTIESNRTQQSNIVAVLFDPDVAAITLEDPRVTSMWNPRGEYITYFNKYDTMLCTFNNVPFVVFVMNDPT